MNNVPKQNPRMFSRFGAVVIASCCLLPAAWAASLQPTPVEYLPEILSAEIRPHSRLEFSPDGREIYWSGYVIGEGTTERMFVSVRQDDGWSVPAQIPVNNGLGNGPALSPDGGKLFFGAQRRLEPGGPFYNGIWYAERSGEGWGDVQPVATTLDSTGFAGRPSFSKNGNLYFLARGSRSEIPAVFRCALENGSYAEPEFLTGAFTGEIVMDPWIDPDEEFLLLMSDDWATAWPSYGSSDLYISYRRSDGSWGQPRNLGAAINTEHFDRSPSVSPDGRFLFFIRAVGDVFVESDAHFYRVRFPKHELRSVGSSDLARRGVDPGAVVGHQRTVPQYPFAVLNRFEVAL